MSIKTFGQGGVAVLFVALIAGCSSGSPRVSDLGNECKIRSKCMYEGSYEPGEREYAEEEAARLNKAASRRLRRSN